MRRIAWLTAVACILCAQERPAFEAASIHASPPGDGRFGFHLTDGGRLTIQNMTVWNLLRQSYGWRDNQIIGGPAWIRSEGFNIEAAPSSPVGRDKAIEMLKKLLEERFHVRWHADTREMSAYALKVDTGGSKLSPAREGQADMRMGNLKAPSMTLDSLCQILEFDAGRPVVDQTGLAGPYAIELHYARDAAVADTSLPSLFTAVREQLGLRLEAAKLPVKVFVIDDAQRPSDN
ncbi:MAG TPA: TIGR03435 family protein [Bryobacteraceae bacterium]|jgi:uncharacterized protein (TIGR03435 family)